MFNLFTRSDCLRHSRCHCTFINYNDHPSTKFLILSRVNPNNLFVQPYYFQLFCLSSKFYHHASVCLKELSSFTASLRILLSRYNPTILKMGRNRTPFHSAFQNSILNAFTLHPTTCLLAH